MQYTRIKRIFLLAVVWSSFAAAINTPLLELNSEKSTSTTYPTVLRVYYDKQSQLQELSEFADVWQINSDQKFAITQVKTQQTLFHILKLGMTARIDEQRVREYNEALRKINNSPVGNQTIPGFACYSTVEHTFQRMDDMVTNHSELAEIVDIGDSWEKLNLTNAGFDMQVIKLTNQNIKSDKPVLFLSSAIHAREYATAELNTRFGEYLLSLYNINADVTWILDNHEIHLLLQTNPDGRKQAEAGDLWRKNTNQDFCGSTSASRGVDLNRNYPYQWGVGNSSTDECSDIFRGLIEGSEPEVTFQIDYLGQIFADNRGPGINDAAPADTPGIFVDIHSFSELVLWPWGYTNGAAANDNQLQALGKRTAFFNQYRPIPVNDLVVTGGGSIDWSYGELGVASLAFELGTSFFQDCDTFENDILPNNLNALLYLARVAQAPYIQSLGPDIESLHVIPNVITADQTIHISGIANDDRYNQSAASQIVETVKAVAVTVNQPPITAPPAQALLANDGVFDETYEPFAGNISSSGFNAGKNLIYVQATDSNDKPGGTFAEFVEVVEAAQVSQLNGQVTDFATGLGVPQALIQVNQSDALTDASGQYNQLVQPGIADMLISADGYAVQTISGLNLTQGSTLTQDVQLQPFCQIFSDDMENGMGDWMPQSPWAISGEQSVSPQNSWTDSPGGEYANNIDVTLISPALDINQADSIEVQYQSLCDTEAGFDYGLFEVQFDGGNWLELSRCDGNPNWVQVNQVISKPANASQMQWRFRLTSDSFVTADGWSIDDVSVKAAGAVCGFNNADIIFADGFEAKN